MNWIFADRFNQKQPTQGEGYYAVKRVTSDSLAIVIRYWHPQKLWTYDKYYREYFLDINLSTIKEEQEP